MASGSNEITLYGILIGAILPLFGYLIFHRLASHRERESRLASASNDFREKIVKATSFVPTSDQYWDNEILNQFPMVLEETKIAVNIYAYFLSDTKKTDLFNTYNKFEKLVNTEIPTALSKENLMYGGGQHTRKEVKELFHKNIEKLKSYAKKT